MSKKSRDGLQEFEDFYQDLFKDRWPALQAALRQPERQVLRRNRFSNADFSRFEDFEKFSDQAWWQTLESGARPDRDELGLLDVYVMDPASLAPALALDVQPGDQVLDVCAAPGGKSLVLAEALWAQGETGGVLIANDLSPDRRERLIKVLQQYVPREVREEKLFVRGQDGAQFGLKQPETFDRILLDAPCSGERHLLENPEELSQWSRRRSEGLAARQYSLLCGAWLALAPGGRLVYSTCALSELENDGVLRKFLKKKKEATLVAEMPGDLPQELLKLAEQTEFGWRFLPDRGHIGPIYFAIIEK